MPPVFSPLSPSSARLWSMEETIGTTIFPSVKERTDTSGPVRNSSMTMLLPLSPKIFSSIMETTASFASSLVSAMITPFPSARPSALITVGIGQVSRYSRAAFSSVNTSYCAVGMPYFFIRFLEKTLLPSMMAAALFGPKAGIPASCSASTQPNTSGSSGATTAKSIFCSFANLTIPSISLAPMSTQVASAAMPPFPGKAKISSTFLFSFSFLMMACSLPPPPTTSSFIFIILSHLSPFHFCTCTMLASFSPRPKACEITPQAGYRSARG